jgi:hypothetical protein
MALQEEPLVEAIGDPFAQHSRTTLKSKRDACWPPSSVSYSNT